MGSDTEHVKDKGGKDSPNAKAASDKPSSPKVSDEKLISEKEADEKSKRLVLYRRDDVRRLVGWMVKGHDEIRPQRSPQTGMYVYSGAEFGLGDISALLSELEAQKIVQRVTMDTVPSCPACQRSNFHVSYVCPYSQHTILEHGTLIEHYACGNADFENNYRSGPVELVCPKCRRTLKLVGTDYRKIERSYRCSGCGKFFGTPKLTLECRSCGRKNDEEELVMPTVYAYKINEQLRSELISHCSLEAEITSLLEKAGFKVTVPTRLTGQSGVPHNFDLGAERGDKAMVMDMVSATDQVGPQHVVEFFAKVYDTKPSKALLIALPRLSEEAKRLGVMYSLETIDGETPDEVTKRLSAVIEIPSTPTTIQPLEPRATALIEQTISSLEKETPTRTQSEESLEADKILKSARERMKPLLKETSTRTQSEESLEADKILKRARERMKLLMKETELAVS